MTAAHGPWGSTDMRKFLKNHGLSLTMLGLFVLCLIGQALAGLRVHNEEAAEHGAQVLGLVAYLRSGAFLEAVSENWESEFLQMAVFVILTKFLLEKGSSESKTPGKNDVDEDPRGATNLRAPWPVRKGGLWLTLYERSLSTALLAFFVAAFLMHAMGGARNYSEQQLAHGGQAVSMWQYLGTANFWFESLQNWQSEFFSVALLVVLSIFLREKGSAQSKPVAMPHAETE
jgi:hypothetical protein